MIRKIGNEWWTAPTESDENGRTVIVTGRRGVEAAMESGKYRIRVEITWRYQGDSTGMPDKPTSMLMEAVQEALTKVFDRDPVAILTGVYTGDDRRDWVFYVTSTHIFERKINEAWLRLTCSQSRYIRRMTPTGPSTARCARPPS